LRRLILIFAVLTASSCTDDVLEASYPSMPEAVAEGAVERGWIPAWIPAEATDLQEVHNVDSNQSALSFTAPAAWHPPAQCRPDASGEPPGPAFNRQWLPSPEILVKTYDLYSCSPGHSGTMLETVAVRRDTRHVVHWRVLAR